MGRGKPEAFTDVWNTSCISFGLATTHNEVRDHRDFQSSLLLERNLDFPDLFYEKHFKASNCPRAHLDYRIGGNVKVSPLRDNCALRSPYQQPSLLHRQSKTDYGGPGEFWDVEAHCPIPMVLQAIPSGTVPERLQIHDLHATLVQLPPSDVLSG